LTECKTFCIGCWRTLDEIQDWRKYTENQKEEIYNKLKIRKKHYKLKER